MHVPSTCNVRPIPTFYMALLCPCSDVPMFRVWCRQLKNWQTRRIQCLKSFPLWHVLVVPLIAVYHNGTCSAPVSIGPQSLSVVRPLVWPVALSKEKEVQIICTCPARAMCTPGQLFIWRRDAPVQLCPCAKFRVASSKIHKLGGSHV